MQSFPIIPQAGGTNSPDQASAQEAAGTGDAFLALFAGLRGGAALQGTDGVAGTQSAAPVVTRGETTASLAVPPPLPVTDGQLGISKTTPNQPNGNLSQDDLVAALAGLSQTTAGRPEVPSHSLPGAEAIARATQGRPGLEKQTPVSGEPAPGTPAIPSAPKSVAAAKPSPASAKLFEAATPTQTQTTIAAADHAPKPPAANPLETPRPAASASAIASTTQHGAGAATGDGAVAVPAQGLQKPRELLARSSGETEARSAPLKSAIAAAPDAATKLASTTATVEAASLPKNQMPTSGQEAAPKTDAKLGAASGEIAHRPEASLAAANLRPSAMPKTARPGSTMAPGGANVPGGTRIDSATQGSSAATGQAPADAAAAAVRTGQDSVVARAPLWSASLFAAEQGAIEGSPGLGMLATDPADAGLDPLPGSQNGSNLGTARSASESYVGTALRGFPAAPAVQVAVQMQRAFDAKANRFTIQLEPAELGRVDVKLDFARDGSLRASITVERPETYDLMQRDLQSLERTLKDLGGAERQLSLDLNLGAGAEQDREAWRQALGEGVERRDGESPNGSSDDSDHDLDAIVMQSGPLQGLVDIRI